MPTVNLLTSMPTFLPLVFSPMSFTVKPSNPRSVLMTASLDEAVLPVTSTYSRVMFSA